MRSPGGLRSCRNAFKPGTGTRDMGMPPTIKYVHLELEWDARNTALLTKKLYRHVHNEETDITLTSRPDPFTTEIVLGEDVAPTIPFTTDLLQYIHKRIEAQNEDGTDHFEHVTVELSNGATFTYHGNNEPQTLLNIVEEVADTAEYGFVQ